MQASPILKQKRKYYPKASKCTVKISYHLSNPNLLRTKANTPWQLTFKILNTLNYASPLTVITYTPIFYHTLFTLQLITTCTQTHQSTPTPTYPQELITGCESLKWQWNLKYKLHVQILGKKDMIASFTTNSVCSFASTLLHAMFTLLNPFHCMAADFPRFSHVRENCWVLKLNVA